MTVGTQANSSMIDGQLTTLSVAVRKLMQQIADLNTYVNGQAQGQALLQQLGYSSADATTALQMIGYLHTLAGVYFGTATQGTDFNFDNALSVLWAAG